MTAALDRVEASRQRLRLAMSPPPPAEDDSPVKAGESWMHRLRDVPAVSAVVESVQAWWAHHPLRPLTQVAGEATNAVVKPLAQGNPLVLILFAAAVGAGLVWSRPWRWLIRSALFAGLVPQLASRVVSKLPIESWMTILGAAFAATSKHPQREAASEAPTT